MRRVVRRELQRSPEEFPADLPAVLRRVYAARQVADIAELDYTLQRLHAPDLLGGIDDAAVLLQRAISDAQRILVIGDFDADGATSCALCVRALRAMGAREVSYLVPSRFTFGYGLTPEIVAVAAQQRPDLIMTVDNGVSSVGGVAAAHAAGIRVLVTDHHLPGTELPQADALVNPNLPGDRFPSKALAGVGVAFYVLMALRARLRDCGWFAAQGIEPPNLAQWLDLVALGTVADVVPLDGNNRILVQQGLQRIRAGSCVPGIRALLEISGRNPSRCVAADLGYAAGPRLNAAGRLEDMSLGIECLLAEDGGRALQLATQLDALNRDRREIEAEMQDQALQIVAHLQLDGEHLPIGLCLFEPGWHQGVIGILAGRIKDRLQRPVIAFARSSPGEIKGSARSVAGLHMRDALDSVATRHPGLLRRFGGHAMAAGLTLAEADFTRFAAAFDAVVAGQLCADDLYARIYTDGALSTAELTLDTARQLRAGGPWGQGFPEPVFDGHFEVLDQRTVGDRHLKLVVRPQAGGNPLDAIAFNTAALAPGCAMVHLAYRLDVNEYRGLVVPQLVVEHLQAQ